MPITISLWRSAWREIPATAAPLCRGESYRHDRIRIAYLSGDFREHAVAYLTARLFECHDRSRFEVMGISFGPEQDSGVGQRIKGALEHFIDVRGKSDREVAVFLRDLEIDIAIDLMGYTANSRTAILTHRAAPIQVNYLGYPGTMGADYIDYIIADRFIIPNAERQFYSEKIIYLPYTFQVNDSRRQISEQTPSRSEIAGKCFRILLLQ